MTDPTLCDAAQEYLSRGWSVFPLQERGKKPWSGFSVMRYQRERLATTYEILKWWNKLPSANIAIATGRMSDLFVWDCDTPQAFTATQRHGIPDTLIARTGKGYHVYFQMPDFPLGNRAKPLPQVDVRGTGGYVVAPPSIHPSGAVYEWVNDYPIAPAPQWIFDVISMTKHTTPTVSSAGEIRNSTAYGMAALRSEAYEVARTATNRNDRLYRAALKMGSLIADGKLDHETVVSTLLQAAAHLSADDGETASWRTILSGINIGLRSSREKYKRA